MRNASPRILWRILPLVAFTIAGCAYLPSPLVLDPPVIESEIRISREATLLEQFQQVSTLYETEKARGTSLENELAVETETRERAQADLESLRKKVGDLERNLAALTDISGKYDEAQKTLQEFGNNVRNLQEGLLKEKLVRIKHEQTIVSLKLEAARQRRKQLIEEGGRAPAALSGGLRESASRDSAEEEEEQRANL